MDNDPNSSSLKLASLLDKIDQGKSCSNTSSEAPTVSTTESTANGANAGTIPYGWVEYFDKSSNLPYYYNVILKTTQWEKPVTLETAVEKTSENTDYSGKAYFSKESGKFSGTSTYWQKMGREEDKAGRQLGVFMDLSTLAENREQAKLMKEEARKNSGSRGTVNWSTYKEEKKATKKRKASAWIYEP